MGRFSTALSSIYRFLIIGIILGIHYQAWTKAGRDIDQSTMVFYGVMILYGVIFTVLHTTKWSAYSELLVVLGLIYYYEHNVLYFVLLLPFVSLVSSKAKQFDLLMMTLIFTCFLYIENYTMEACVLLGFAIYVTLNVFYSKFGQIEFLQTNVFDLKKKIEKLDIELGNKQKEIDITSSMFLHSKYLSETIEIDELIQLMVNSSKEFFDAEYACLYLRKDDGFYLEKEAGKNVRFEIPSYLPLEEAENIRIENKMIRMTIDYEKKAWGIIAVYGKRLPMGGQPVPFPFQEEDFEVLSVYVTMAMSPIKHAKLLKTMNYLANNDFLTGISNRRHFVENFGYLSKMAQRGQALSLLILDIDHFKQFNDEFGHDIGDKVLKEVAETIKYTIREVDVVGRLGGEEFAVLLTGVGENEEFVANRIRARVEAIPFERNITVSIGIANYKEHGDTWEQLYKHADEALYHAKANGRNQVVLYEPYMS